MFGALPTNVTTVLANLMLTVVLMVVVHRAVTAGGRHGGLPTGNQTGTTGLRNRFAPFDPLNHRFDMWRNGLRRVEQLLDVRISWLERERRADRRRDAGENPL